MTLTSCALALLMLWIPLSAMAASDGAAVTAAGTAEVAASDRYRAGRVHRWILGGGYRDLWKQRIELPVLSLRDIGGGLTPVGRFGGLQTAVLAFEGADGRSYSFRGTDKDPSAVLDDMLRDTIVQTIVQDQMAAQHPAGPPVAGVLTAAAGVLTVHETLVVMPDDPLLGEYREQFAGMVGTFFEYPRPRSAEADGFARAEDIIDHEELYQRLAENYDTPVDQREFLRARLMDLLLGDFDRHRKQWRWAKLPGVARWQPIPEDRDQAFVRYDGVAQRIMRLYIPILQEYGASYPGMKGLTLHGWEQDRYLLPSLEWITWASVAEEIQADLTDEVIERAVAALPAPYAAMDADRLTTDIRGRRDNLLDAARRFYRHLSREVDIHATDLSERIQVTHGDGGELTVQIFTIDSAKKTRHYSRRFDPDETRDVRIYLRGGSDEVIVAGGTGTILVRVITEGPDPKRLDDSRGGRTRIYDESRSATVIEGRHTKIDRRPYTPPEPDSGFVDVEDVPPRDWGTDTLPFPEFGFQPDVGVFLGAQASHTRYAFRKHPWASKHVLGFGWAFEANAPRVRYRGQFRPENSELIGEVLALYSGIEVLRFYGFGNETSDRGNDREFRVRNEQYRADFTVSTPVWVDNFRVRAGPYLHVSRTFNGVRLIDRTDPYGNNDFGLVGALLNLRLDTRESTVVDVEHIDLSIRDNPAEGFPTSGFLVDITAQFSPPVWDVDTSYGSIRGSIAGFLSFGDGDWLTVAARVGGMETFSRTPYFDQAAIGGGRLFSGDATNRGYRARRFQGDSSVYGNFDARVVLGRVKLVVPGDIGLHGFFDVGRVFLNDESSDDWHPSGGGGIWFSPLVRTNTISLSVAESVEDTLVYLRLGFHY